MKKNVEVKLFDGFILDYFFPSLLSFSINNKVYTVAPEFIKHGLYDTLVKDIGIKEHSQENYCYKDCFASHERYNIHAGLCEKHSKIISDLKSKIQMDIKNTLFCHTLREEKLKEEINNYEKEFSEQTGIKIGSISFSRERAKIKDGDWLIVYKDRGDELLTDSPFYFPEIKDEDAKKNIIDVFQLFSIRPSSNINEYIYRFKNRLDSSLVKNLKVLSIFDKTNELTIDEIKTSFPETNFDKLFYILESLEHKSLLYFDEDTKIYKITENGREFLNFSRKYLEKTYKIFEDMKTEIMKYF